MPRSKASTLAALAIACGLGSLQPLMAATADADAQPTFAALRATATGKAKPSAPEMAPAPTAFELRGVLMADGTVATDCHEVPNPEARNGTPEAGDRQREAH